MKVVINGSPDRVKALEDLIPSEVDTLWVDASALSAAVMRIRPDVVFLTDMDERPGLLSSLTGYEGVVVGCAVKRSLLETASSLEAAPPFTLLGMNMWPFFLGREWREMSRLPGASAAAFIEAWGWKVRWVEDRVGMVTPRILVMIINEAYYTVQEGTAGRDAIDTAMQLGTNYPGGPFEWVSRMGAQAVYGLLERLWEDTHDPRYRPAPLLKAEALQQRLPT